MAGEVFVDSSGLYALADLRDPFHVSVERCVGRMLKSGTSLVLTDGYSFTDCTSFVIMQELRIRDTLSTDRHFTEAGFRPLLAVS